MLIEERGSRSTVIPLINKIFIMEKLKNAKNRIFQR